MGFLKKIIGSITGANAAKKAQEAAIRAQQEAEKRNVTVQAVAADPVRQQSDTEREEEEERLQSSKKRRFSIASTVRGGSLLARGLLGGRKTLG